jgi:hypothetical protein
MMGALSASPGGCLVSPRADRAGQPDLDGDANISVSHGIRTHAGQPTVALGAAWSSSCWSVF